MSQLVLSRRGLLGAAAATGALSLAGRDAKAADKLKAAWIYVGPIGDYGYSYQHNQGRLAVDKAMGDQVKTSFVEKVPEGPDAERVLRQLATSGNELIFATSFGFMDSVIRVASQFPKIKFEHATGYKQAKNVSIYNARFYEGRAVIGNMAGHITKSGTVGYIVSFPIPEVVMGVNSFILAAQKVRPDIKVKLVWVNSWYDPGKEADAAKVLIDQGADVIAQHTDLPAALQVAQERGVVGFGQSSDMQQVRARGAAHRHRRRLGALLSAALQGRAGRHLEVREHLVGPEGGDGRDRPLWPQGDTRGRVGGRQGQGRHHRRHAPSLHRPDQGPEG